jgi:hypothetical protein
MIQHRRRERRRWRRESCRSVLRRKLYTVVRKDDRLLCRGGLDENKEQEGLISYI